MIAQGRLAKADHAWLPTCYAATPRTARFSLFIAQQHDHIFIARHQPGEAPTGPAIEESQAHDVHEQQSPEGACRKSREDSSAEPLPPAQRAREKPQRRCALAPA